MSTVINIIDFLDLLKERGCFDLPFINESYGLAFPRSMFTSDKKKWLMPSIINKKSIKYIIPEDVRPNKAFFYRPRNVMIDYHNRKMSYRVSAVFYVRQNDTLTLNEKINQAVAAMESAISSSSLGKIMSVDLDIVSVLEDTSLWMAYSASGYTQYDVASFVPATIGDYNFFAIDIELTPSINKKQIIC